MDRIKRFIALLLTAAMLTAAAPAVYADDAEAPTEPAAVEAPAENVGEAPAEAPVDAPAEVPAEAPAEVPAETPPAAPAEPAAEPAPASTEAPAPVLAPYSVINYRSVEGYDISDIPNRGGVSCTLSRAADILAMDMSEAVQRIFAAAPTGDRILTYSGAGRDIYPELLTYVTAVFLARNYGNIIENPMDHILTAEEMTALRRVYWEVLTLTAVIRDTESFAGELDAAGNPVIQHTYVSQVNVDTIAVPELAQPLTEEESFRLNIYLAEPMRSAVKSALRGNVESHVVQEEEPLRSAIAASACSLAGLVPYYWGGKSDKLGWDVRWGTPSLLQDGSVMPFGLDCSGLVVWSFVNGAGSADAQSVIGHGAHRQYLNSVPIDQAEARVGDLVFTMMNGTAIHVGIIVGRDANGELLVCHASGRVGENIVIETMSKSGCSEVRTPKAFYDAY